MMDLESEVRSAVREYEKVTGHAATRTWQMITRHGTVGALSRLMESGDAQKGFKALIAAGRADLTFEAVVLRYPSQFSRAVVDAARWRLEKAKSGEI